MCDFGKKVIKGIFVAACVMLVVAPAWGHINMRQIERNVMRTKQSCEIAKIKAEHGDAAAAWYLGKCYANGYIVGVKDKSKGAYWYEIAASHGFDVAQYEIGKCYYDGDGVPMDKEKAVYLFKEAANQGYAQAQYYLGLCYYEGDGVPKDEEKAVNWLQQASDQGDEDARELLSKIKSKGFLFWK